MIMALRQGVCPITSFNEILTTLLIDFLTDTELPKNGYNEHNYIKF